MDGQAPQYCLHTGGIGAYARTVSEGGTYHPVYVQLAFRVWIPCILKVGKMGAKISLNWHFSAGLMLQDLACLAL